MGGSASRREPEVHVVVVQSQENGKMDAKVLRQTYTSLRKPGKVHPHNGGESPTTPPLHEMEPSFYDPQDLYHLERAKHPAIDRMGESRSDASTPLEKQPPTNSHDDHMTPRKEKDRQSHHHHLSSNQNGYGLSSFSAVTMDTGTEDGSVSKYTGHRGDRKSVGMAGEELSTLSEKTGNMFELFRTHDGEDYTVYVREDGKRFYVDFEEQKWRYFPDSWNERGSFVPIDYDPYQGNQSEQGAGRDKEMTDKREGEFIHPTRGKLNTYLKQETLNVLYFFDETSGVWLPMPLSWERHVPAVAPLIAEIQKACPDWKDARGIVSMLRLSNYSVDDCTSAYMAINDDGVLDYSDHGPGRDPFRSLTEKKLKETTAQLGEAKMKYKEMSNKLEHLQAKVEEFEADNKRMKKEIETGKEEQRKKSKVLSRQLSHSINFGRSVKLEVIRPLIHILGEESRTLKAKLNTLRSVAEKGLNGYEVGLKQLSKALSQLILVHRKQAKEVVEVRTLYRKEAMERKLLYNEVQELRGNIRVFCRCRPDDSGKVGLQFDGEERVICMTAQGRKKVYEFERVYEPHTKQEKVFEDTKPTITSCVDGYNVCIIAYGQTGAGKTYTMMGPKENPGVNLRSMKELFKICRERTKIKYTLQVSMVEVYNESIYDLLAPPDEGHEKLTIQKKGKDIVVPGLTEIEVRSMQDIMMIFNEGEKNRTVASTKMNTNSSRSHLLFTLKVEGYDTVSKATSRGRLTLVDLAGSERISRSEASGIRLVEAAAINKSLSALGQVFISIRNGALHVPYRNSKLTHLLQPCIGGDSKACMFVNVSPLDSNMAETISTLEFGINTRQVELGKATKHVTRA